MENSKLIDFSRKTINNTKNICEYLGVPVAKYSSPNTKPILNAVKASFGQNFTRYGFTLYIPPCDEHSKKSIICYNDSKPERVQAVTLAHELGHVLMEEWDTPTEERTKIGEMDKGEFFAEMFACIMMALNVMNIKTE